MYGVRLQKAGTGGKIKPAKAKEKEQKKKTRRKGRILTKL